MRVGHSDYRFVWERARETVIGRCLQLSACAASLCVSAQMVTAVALTWILASASVVVGFQAAKIAVSQKIFLIHELAILSLWIFEIAGMAWFSPIDEHIYLSGLPLTSHKHLEWMQKNGVKHVISLVEEWEYNAPNMFGKPIKADEYRQANISLHKIPIKDHTAPASKELFDIVRKMHNIVSRGEKVVVHCKMGRGRSATAVMAYYLLYHPEVQNPLALIKKQRKIVQLNKLQCDALEAFKENFVCQNDLKHRCFEEKPMQQKAAVA